MDGGEQAGERVGLLIKKCVSIAWAAPGTVGRIPVSFDGARPPCAGAKDWRSTQGDNLTHFLRCPARTERVPSARAVPRMRNGASSEAQEVARRMQGGREVRMRR